jgi:hypothetical protein
MTDIIKLAREAGEAIALEWDSGGLAGDSMYMEFAEQVALRVVAQAVAQEREACALKCVASELIDMPTRHEIAVVRKCAAAIRARAKEQTP